MLKLKISNPSFWDEQGNFIPFAQSERFGDLTEALQRAGTDFKTYSRNGIGFEQVEFTAKFNGVKIRLLGIGPGVDHTGERPGWTWKWTGVK